MSALSSSKEGLSMMLIGILVRDKWQFSLVDDTNGVDPLGAKQATLDFINHGGNKYEILLDAQTRGNKHPTFWNGIMILRKC